MTVFRSAFVCSLFLFLAASFMTGCSSSSEAPGSASLDITLPDGSEITEVSYEITGNGIDPIVGTIPVGDLGSTISALVSGIPAGTGYLLTLSATSDAGTVCGGDATFDVIAGQTTRVAITLQCRAEDDDGDVVIDGGINQCPTIDSFVAFPLAVQIGTPVNLSSVASDLDGDALTYAWTADSGNFADAAAASTEYNCTLAGPAVITLTVDDGNGCADTKSVEVRCTSQSVCGNGELEVGEACDDGNTESGDGCSMDCRKVEVCGDGEVDAGEVCDDGNTDSGDGCSADCQVIEGCGNGTVDAGEECDGGPDCSSTCTLIICGNGRVDEGEECDDGNDVPNDTCTNECTVFDPALACTQCEEEFCRDFNGADVVEECQNAVGVAADGPAAGTAKSELCLAYLDCARTTGCGAGSEEECYCGAGVPINTCLIRGGQGVCRAEAEAAAETVDSLTIAERFVNPNFALGNASRLLRCDKQFCSGECF